VALLFQIEAHAGTRPGAGAKKRKPVNPKITITNERSSDGGAIG
jgi:hypothetical protein